MSAFWNWLEGGYSMPADNTWGRRLALRVGRYLASRHANATIARTARIHPEARICPRNGRLTIGERSTVALGSLVQGNVTIGDDCSVQAYGNLVGYGHPDATEGRITIGNKVRIASHCIMVAANHKFSDPDQPIHGQGMEHASINIEDDVWIGARVNLTAGVTIGRGSVIGGGSVVTKDIPPYSIAVGVPAKVIKQRDGNG